MVFYVVKGDDDACGRGCNRWIAVEGEVDPSAAIRFRRFLQRLGNRDLPVYLYSPGGNLDQALAMGSLLRERGATARVGRTLIGDCGFEAQDSPACLGLKQSGRELRGELWTRGAICHSACPYLMLGAITREVAPDAVLAVHSAKVVMHYSDGEPTATIREAATQRNRERADQVLASYVVKMGADIALFDLARTIKFESMHVLTREEIVRFGIDGRDLAETGWKFENGTRSMVRKTALVKDDGGKSWRLSQWRITCAGSEQFDLDFQRPAGSAVSPAITISLAGATQAFHSPPAKSRGFEVWETRLSRTAAQGLADAAQFEFTESSVGADGKRMVRAGKFSTEGLSPALATLAETCPTPNNMTLRQTVGAHESAAK